MTAIIEIQNNCDARWVPSTEQCEHWLNSGLHTAGQNGPCNVSLSFVDAEHSQSLNREFRDKDQPTNVLSFPAEFPAELHEQVDYYPLGDIVICAAVVETEATAQDKQLAEHWAHLTLHGLFHLLGYDHESERDAEKMEALEIKTLEILGIGNPYLLV